MGWLENVIIENRRMDGERLELSDKRSLYFLGPHLTLKNCTLILKVAARNLLLREGTRFIDCHIDVKQELKNHQDWVFTSLEGCRFKGRLSGCDLGRWPGYAQGSGRGFIADCDFSEALLDGCRFMGCDPQTLKFPPWPCFTLLDPIRRAPEWLAAPWPSRFKKVVIETLQRQPEPTMALSLFAPSEAKRFDTSPEELRAVIETLDGVVY